MITLNYTPKDEITGLVSDEIIGIEFEKSDELFIFLCAELHADDDFVYLLAVGDDQDGNFIYIDHVTGNILGMLQFMSDGILEESVYLFYEKTYEEAYKLATDMKEETGLAYDWQLECKNEKPTVKNGGIKVNSLIN